jgi:uncharacterized membrane protein YgdD (TMEM256/DUF423 family)
VAAMNSERIFLTLSGVNGFLAVGLGAFGAHGLRKWLAGSADGGHRLEVWETAARYHLAHAIALAICAYLTTRTSSQAAIVAGWSMQAGIVIFCGSLYGLTLSGTRALGAITPFGGLCLLAGWLAIVVAALSLGKWR